MEKSHNNKKTEPRKYKLRRIGLNASGPIFYLVIAFLPWVQSEITLPKLPKILDFSSLTGLSKIELPKIKLPSFSNKQKSAQIGTLSLNVDPTEVRLSQSSGYQSTNITYNNFNLHWDKDSPLILAMPDGSEQKLLPSAHQVLDNAITLDFGTTAKLFFYPKAAEQENLKIELAWLGKQDLPTTIRLPWGTKNNPIALENGQLSTAPPESSLQFAAIADITITDEKYIEIPLHYHAFIEHSDTRNYLEQEEARIISLISQSSDQSPSTTYQKLYTHYQTRLFQNLQQNSQNLQTPEAAALYLEMLLEKEPKLPPSPPETSEAYQTAYEQVRLLAQQNSWNNLYLAPFIGISQNALEENIQQENQRINQVRTQYLLSNWSFVGQQDTANLIFDYGDLNLLLGLTQRAIAMKQQVSNEELFYLNYYLWNLTSIYPRNPYILPATARAEFLAQLRELSQTWQKEIPNGTPMRFALDVLKALWDFPEIQATQLAIKLLQTMDRNGKLPSFYNQTQGNTIPIYESWPILSEPSLVAMHPQNSTVVPGFWIWTSGSPEVFFESGQPIVVTSNNFLQGNKLLLLRGIYFYPQEITVDGQAINPTNQIPIPELGQTANWFYNPQGRYLLIQTSASTQSTSEIIIR